MKELTSYWDLVAPICEKVSIYDGPKMFLSQFMAMPVRARVLLAAHWCQSEVRNGGFAQLFGNSTGVLCPEAARAFRTIRMPKSAALVATAMRLFPLPYPRHRGIRRAKLNRIDAMVLEEMDTVFFKLLSEESGGFEVAAVRYANKRRL